MDDQLTNDPSLFRYLLGQLSEAERAQVEERFLNDSEYYEQLLVVEDEIRCAYAKGALSAEERERFEKQFLIFPDERQKVALAKEMIGALSSMQVEEAIAAPGSGRQKERLTWEKVRALLRFKSPAMGWALACATTIILAALVWLAIETARLRSQVYDLQSRQTKREQEIEQQSAEARARVEELNRELEAERQNRTLLEQELAAQREQSTSGESLRSIISLILVPGQIRGGGGSRQLTIPQNSAQVRLLLNIGEPNSYKSFQAVIRNSEGVQVWSRAGLRASLARGAQFVILRIPARQLAEDDFEINLKGFSETGEAEHVSDYYFTVLKK